jgi:hypothetical protein
MYIISLSGSMAEISSVRVPTLSMRRQVRALVYGPWLKTKSDRAGSQAQANKGCVVLFEQGLVHVW